MKIKLKNVRLSFPSLFQKGSFNGQETKYEATFLLDKDSQSVQIKEVKAAIASMIKTDLKGARLGDDKICMKDGGDTGRDGYENAWSLKAANASRPLVINRDQTPLAEDDNVIYSGCYVNAVIRLWPQDNAYGKRINASLDGVQFVKDGDSFGTGGGSASVSDFEILDEAEDKNADDNIFG